MNTEFLGYFGLSWQEKLASDLYNLYADNSLKLSGLSSITHGSNWNTAYIDQIETAFKQGQQEGYSGSALADYMRKLVEFTNPKMADSYVNLRGTQSGSTLENAVGSILKPVANVTGSVVEKVTTPLNKTLIIVAVIAVVGLIGYGQLSKNTRSTLKKAVL